MESAAFSDKGEPGAPTEVTLIRPGDRSRGTAQTPGMDRQQALATDKHWSGYVSTAPGMASGWHHHNEFDSVIYVLSGALRMESGPAGRHIVDAVPGDFLFVPRHAIHRESNPTDQDAGLIVVRIGSGVIVVNTDGPAPDE